MKYMYPSHLIDKQVKRFLHNKFFTKMCDAVKEIKQLCVINFPI